ncbi:MAG TPA: hypothetical protein VNV86_04830 [Candidatus Acidoferrum sp.]|nr:hypothetical protein [Candidatus Acidoferrum sp.]
MNLGALSGLTNNSNVQSVFRSADQDSGLTTANTTSSASQSRDKSQLSPFAQMMSSLQQLQQSDPAKYQQVTQQIATNLQSAAQTAQANGDSAAADRLNQLAGDFSSASKSGDLPNMRDMGQSLGAHHHGHGRHHAAAASSDSASQTLSQVLAAYQNTSSPSTTLDPMSIVSDTISESMAN